MRRCGCTAKKVSIGTFPNPGRLFAPYKTDTFLKKLKVVAAVGDEVDRMEKNIVRVEPTIHYVDLETYLPCVIRSLAHCYHKLIVSSFTRLHPRRCRSSRGW